MNRSDQMIVARAPGKVILFGEHAVNRGQPAIAAALGIYAECRAARAGHFQFESGAHRDEATRAEVLELAREIDECRHRDDLDRIRRLAAADFFAPQKYLLGAALGEALPGGLRLEWRSEVPRSSGLGSGGSAFAALALAVGELCAPEASLERRAAWAYCGDVVAHGGVASGIDTQTSLLGGVVLYTGAGLARPLDCGAGWSLVIGNTRVAAATGEVNTRVRRWLEERPVSRRRYFEAVGALVRSAGPALERGDGEELGRLMTLNQLVLEKIGVSCPECDRLIQAALEAGAYGAKISGSGGGGIMVALAAPERAAGVFEAIAAAGGEALAPEAAVAGAAVVSARATRAALPSG